MTRRYELKRRATGQVETRQRIVDATIELHESIGAAQTTISEIAKRAGVGRVTVYRHFPDEQTLYAACSGHYFSQHPFPDLDGWRQIPGPVDRLRRGLRDSYAWYDENRQMIGMALAEARDLPPMAPYHRYLAEAAGVLTEPWDAHGREGCDIEAVTALALSFDTHRSLTREQHLGQDTAIELVIRLIESMSPARARAQPA
jgi:AcrR family transcriptional regulator